MSLYTVFHDTIISVSDSSDLSAGNNKPMGIPIEDAESRCWMVAKVGIGRAMD
jgi:hypothetical protein